MYITHIEHNKRKTTSIDLHMNTLIKYIVKSKKSIA